MNCPAAANNNTMPKTCTDTTVAAAGYTSAAIPTIIRSTPQPNIQPHVRRSASSSAATCERKYGNPVVDMLAPDEESRKGDLFHHFSNHTIRRGSVRGGLVSQNEPVPQAVWSDQPARRPA